MKPKENPVLREWPENLARSGGADGRAGRGDGGNPADLMPGAASVLDRSGAALSVIGDVFDCEFRC